MRKLLCLFLTLATIGSLISCSQLTADPLEIPLEETLAATEEKEPESLDDVFERKGFSTGYARVDITPSMSVPLGGFYNAASRPSDLVKDRLYATCVAVSDGEKIALFFSYDNLNTPTYLWEQLAKMVEKDLGIPKELVWLTSTHTHYSPAFASSNDTRIIRHLAEVYPAFRQCAKRAVETLDQSEIYIGKTETVGLNYVRRYVYKDGTPLIKDEVKKWDPELIAHESFADPEMLIIKFDRKNAKDIVMANWQSHYTGAGLGNNDISASWVAGWRRRAEEVLGVDFAFYLGAGGDVVTGSNLPGENNGKSYMAHGAALADTMIAAMGSLQKIEPGKISGMIKKEPIYYNRDTEGYNIEAAREILRIYATDSVRAAALAAQYNFKSCYHAMGIANRANATQDTRDINICVIRVGSIAFASTPYEMFNQSGKQLKERSPFDFTFMCAYTNGSNGYIPTKEAFPNGGYEVNVCSFKPGTAEQVVDSLVELLESLQEND